MSNQLSATSFIVVLMAFIASCGNMLVNEGTKSNPDASHFTDFIDSDSTIYCDTRFAVCFKIPIGMTVDSGFWNVSKEDYQRYERGNYALELFRCTNTDSAMQMGFNIVNFSENLRKIRESDKAPEELKQLTAWKVFQLDTNEYRRVMRAKMTKFGSQSGLKVSRIKIFETDGLETVFYYPAKDSNDGNEFDIIYFQLQFLKGDRYFTYFTQLPMAFYFENELYYRKLYMDNLKVLTSSLRYADGKGTTTYSNEWFTHEIAF